MSAALRRSVAARQPLLGTFLKTASHQSVEVLGRTGLDFLVVDAEHAPFDRADLDRMLLAARSVALPCLVRVPSAVADGSAGAALDMGAAGILFPRVAGLEAARHALAGTRFRGGTRGVSPSPRAGDYGLRNLAEYLKSSDAATSSWCQIETLGALEAIDEIAAIEELDCLFIGRADLAHALHADGLDDLRVTSAVAAIAGAARRHSKAVGIYITHPTEVAHMLALGISVFVCGSDQSWLAQHGRALVSAFAQVAARPGVVPAARAGS